MNPIIRESVRYEKRVWAPSKITQYVEKITVMKISHFFKSLIRNNKSIAEASSSLRILQIKRAEMETKKKHKKRYDGIIEILSRIFGRVVRERERVKKLKKTKENSARDTNLFKRQDEKFN